MLLKWVSFTDKDPDGDRNAETAINNPGDYVLKPQREGGGKGKVIQQSSTKNWSIHIKLSWSPWIFAHIRILLSHWDLFSIFLVKDGLGGVYKCTWVTVRLI